MPQGRGFQQVSLFAAIVILWPSTSQQNLLPAKRQDKNQ
jgi:hypothetical protein